MIKIEENQVFNIIYDGKEYSKEAFTKISEEAISDIVATEGELKKGTIYAFSDRKILEKWIQPTEYYEKYKSIMEKLETVKPELTEEKEIELELLQSSAIHHSTNHILNELKYYNVKPHEIQKFIDLSEKYDIFRGPLAHSAYVFDYCNYGGTGWFLPGGFWYPKFSWFKFNDRMSSLVNFGALSIFCQHKWFGGRWLWVFGIYWISCLTGSWNFNNRASSAIIY